MLRQVVIVIEAIAEQAVFRFRSCYTLLREEGVELLLVLDDIGRGLVVDEALIGSSGGQEML